MFTPGHLYFLLFVTLHVAIIVCDMCGREQENSALVKDILWYDLSFSV